MFEVALGIPGNLKRFSPCYASGKVRVGDLLDPGFELLVEGARFDSVDGTVNRKQSVL